MKFRCFIAINLPQNVREELAKIITALKKKNSGWQIKYVKPEGIHLTLHFLGYLEEGQVDKVKEILKETVEKYHPFNLRINQLGGFPNLEHPKVLFVFGTGETAVAQQIQQELGGKSARAGFEVEVRPWQVHFTLARIKAPVQLNLDKINIPSLNFKVESVELMASHLKPSGSEYEILESYKLK